jgi:hypothetical protein
LKLSKVNKGGRPSAYETRIKPNLKLIHTLRENGHSHEEIIEMLNIAKSTYYKHKREIEEFSHSLKNGDVELLEKLEHSLYDRALGKVKKVVISTTVDHRGNETKTERIEDVPPSDVALFFALTNLKGDKWKHKQENTNSFNPEDLKEVKTFTDTFIELMSDKDERHED